MAGDLDDLLRDFAWDRMDRVYAPVLAEAGRGLSGMAVVVRPLERAGEAAWDRFVEAMPAGTFFHRAGWATVIETAFGHATHYSFTERDGAVTGVLPLVRVKTLLFGDTLISNPFCVYGGPLAADAESEAALIAHAEGLLVRTGARALEFRHLGPAAEAERLDRAAGSVCDVSESDRGRSRAQHEGDPAQAAGDGAEGDPERAFVGCRTAMWVCCTGSMRRACATWGRRCSRAAISGR